MMDQITQKERKLSRFFARQLLFDYMEGRLDEIRRRSLEKSLAEDSELAKDLEDLKRANDYCKTLAATRIDEDFLIHVSQHRSWLEDGFRILSWRQWPEVLKWTAEAVLISAVVVGFMTLIPWNDVWNKIRIENVAVSPAEEEENRLANIQVEAIEKSIEDAAPAPTALPTPAPKAVAPPKAVIAETKPAPTERPQAAPQGLLYRMMMKVPDIKDRAADLRRRVQDMGGAKAGRVEMGWRKPNGNYFHFSLPESRYQSLLNVLGEMGPVRVYKNPHERVMPEGQIRVILWIEDGEVDESSAPTEAEETPSESTAEPQEE